jgi:hypothetical protein
MTVRPVKTPAGLAVEAQVCGSATPALIHTITVSKYEPPRGGTTVLCRLDRAAGPGSEQGPAIRGSWRYGDSPPGYVIGMCGSLESGQEYLVGVQGSGGGSAVFQLDKDGNVRILRQDCR